jgi:hypothetical protein
MSGFVGWMRMRPDVPRALEAQEGPGLPGVRGLPDAEVRRHVAADGLLTETGVDHVGIGLGDRNGTDGTAEVAVGDVEPLTAAVDGLPDPPPVEAK